MRLIRNLILLVLAVYCGTMGYFALTQRQYIYFPDNHSEKASDFEPPYGMEAITVTTEDKVSLTGWYAKATRKPFTLLFFHGNADSMVNAASIAEPYVDAGYGVFLAEYRGYGGNQGKPDENGLYADARAYVAKLFDLGVEMPKIIAMGHSLGGAMATQVVREFHLGGLVLLAPFRSLPALAGEKYKYFLTNLLVMDRYANDIKIPDISAPLLIIHGDQDSVIPLAHSQKLYDLAKEPKSLEVLLARDHGDLFEPAAPIVLDWLAALPSEK